MLASSTLQGLFICALLLVSVGFAQYLYLRRPRPVPEQKERPYVPMPGDPTWPRRLVIAVTRVDLEENGVTFGDVDGILDAEERDQKEGRAESSPEALAPWLCLAISDADPDHPTEVSLRYDHHEINAYVTIRRYELLPGRALLYLEGARWIFYGADEIEVHFPPEIAPDLQSLDSALQLAKGTVPCERPTPMG